MILRRLILLSAAIGALAAAAAVVFVALAYALYAAVKPDLGAAGAAAVVAGAAAMLVGLGAMLLLVVGRRGRVPSRRISEPPPGNSILQRAIDVVRERPMMAVAAAVGVGFLAIRNPRYLGSALRAFAEGRGRGARP